MAGEEEHRVAMTGALNDEISVRRESEERWANRLVVILAMAVVALGVSTAVGFLTGNAPDPYAPVAFRPQPRPVCDPCGDPPVVPTLEGYEGPAVWADGTVPTGGQRCVAGDDPVVVIGQIHWQRLDDPALRVHTVDDFPTILRPNRACVDLAFRNEIPPAVERSVEQGQEAERWTITGSVTPTRPGGVAAVWSIEPFWVVPTSERDDR